MKKRIRKTGEIVDVIDWYSPTDTERNENDSVSYIDSKGNECVKVKGLNIAWDFEDVLDTEINWGWHRLELVKTITHGQLTGPIVDGIDPNPSISSFAKQVVKMADAIIEELKKGDSK